MNFPNRGLSQVETQITTGIHQSTFSQLSGYSEWNPAVIMVTRQPSQSTLNYCLECAHMLPVTCFSAGPSGSLVSQGVYLSLQFLSAYSSHCLLRCGLSCTPWQTLVCAGGFRQIQQPFLCHEFISSRGFNSTVSLRHLSALGRLSHIASLCELAPLQPPVFWQLFLHLYAWAPTETIPTNSGRNGFQNMVRKARTRNASSSLSYIH